MKRFLKNISIFILLMGVINVYFFLIVYDNYFVQYEQVENDYHTYLLSDSHGEPLGKKDEKYKFYNFSSASESYVDMKRKTHYLIENTDVKRIIITADNHMLSPYRDKSNNLDRSSYFAPMSEYDSPLQYFKESYIKRYIPLLNSKSRDIIKIHFTAEKEAFEKEKDWWDLTASEREKKVKDRIEYQFSKPHGSIKQARALLEIIDLCKTNNIELIGIKYPLSREYYNELGDLNYRGDSILILNDCKVYDFSDIFLDRDDFFVDPDHVSQDGAKIFTDKLVRLGQ